MPLGELDAARGTLHVANAVWRRDVAGPVRRERVHRLRDREGRRRRPEDPRDDALGESSEAARRRVWCPDLNGTIATADGAKILVSIKGYSIIEETPTVNRAIVAAVWFRTDDPRYWWLNYYLGIAEGEIDETTEEWWIRISAVRNDVAKAPPKIQAAKWPV